MKVHLKPTPSVENVKGPFWFAQPGDAMTGSIGQGSPAAAAHRLTLLNVKRSHSFDVEFFSLYRLTVKSPHHTHPGPVIACCVFCL